MADSEPKYISIEKLGIQMLRITKVGLDSNNILNSPSNINDAGWYSKSATPGMDYGTVMINGHNRGITKNGPFVKISQFKYR